MTSPAPTLYVNLVPRVLSTLGTRLTVCLDLWKQCRRIRSLAGRVFFFSPETLPKGEDLKIKRRVDLFPFHLFIEVEHG